MSLKGNLFPDFILGLHENVLAPAEKSSTRARIHRRQSCDNMARQFLGGERRKVGGRLYSRPSRSSSGYCCLSIHRKTALFTRRLRRDFVSDSNAADSPSRGPIHRRRLLERFLEYVRVGTTANPASEKYPSSEGQRKLGSMLVDQLKALGVVDAHQDENGLVWATLPATVPGDVPTILLNAHMDTSPELRGMRFARKSSTLTLVVTSPCRRVVSESPWNNAQLCAILSARP